MTRVLIFALLFAQLLFAQQATPPEKCTLAGTVTDSITGLPLGKVDVAAEHVNGHDPGASTATDAQGKFLLVDIDPGQYHLSLRRNGYLDTYFGAKRDFDGLGSTITLTAGEKLENLHAKLTPFGVIAGTVSDSDGEPLAGAALEVYALLYQAGRRSIEAIDSDLTTDDLGQYRVVHLPPGRYYISASMRPRDADKPTVDHSAKSDHPPETPVTTFYPGTADPSSADVVELAPGARATGVDIRLVRSHLYKVTAHIEARAGFNVEAQLNYTVEGFGHAGHSRRLDSAGDVEITGVPPGHYTMHYGAYLPGKPYDGTIDLTAVRDGCGSSIPVSLERGDVEGLRVAVNGCAEVDGRVIREDGKPLDHKGFFPYGIGLDGPDSGYLKADNSFRMTLSPGHHTLDFTNITGQGELYLKSIRSGGQDVLRNGFTVTGSERIELEVVLASDGGRIEGVVSDADGKPDIGASVVLIPNDSALRSQLDYTRSVTSDQNGRFEIKNAAPGEYKLFAWDDIEKDSWFDPDVLRDFEARGQAVSVKAKDPSAQTNPSQTVNLTVIR